MKTASNTIKLFAGAWKVAYGDFITSLMALFLVLWVLSMQVEQTFATTDYFQSAYLFGYTPSDPIIQPETRVGSIVNQIIGYEESVIPKEEDSYDPISYRIVEQMAMEFYKLLNLEEPDPQQRVKMELESDSLRITLFENDRYPIFTGQNGNFTEWGSTVMKNMAWLLDRHDMRVRIDAHTYRKDVEGNDFATTNAQTGSTRDALVKYGLTPKKIEQLTSFGSSTPDNVDNPEHIRNQRLEISIVFDKDTEVRTDLLD
jgi:chemotaxis protein MotB